MRPNRVLEHLYALVLAAVAISMSTNLRAQTFEGTITLDISTHGKTAWDSAFKSKPKDMKSEVTITFKGQKFFMPFNDSLLMYGDHARGKIVMAKRGAAKGVEMSLDDEPFISKDNADEPTTVLATGKKRSISGFDCVQFTINSEPCGESDWWMTAQLPKSMQAPILSAFWHTGVAAKTLRRNDYFGGEPMEGMLKMGWIPIEMDTKFDGKISNIVTIRKIEDKKLDDSTIAVPREMELIFVPTH